MLNIIGCRLIVFYYTVFANPRFYSTKLPQEKNIYGAVTADLDRLDFFIT